MATTHREEEKAIDGICVDCQCFYECHIRESTEERDKHITECGQFKVAETE